MPHLPIPPAKHWILRTGATRIGCEDDRDQQCRKKTARENCTTMQCHCPLSTVRIMSLTFVSIGRTMTPTSLFSVHSGRQDVTVPPDSTNAVTFSSTSLPILSCSPCFLLRLCFLWRSAFADLALRCLWHSYVTSNPKIKLDFTVSCARKKLSAL